MEPPAPVRRPLSRLRRPAPQVCDAATAAEATPVAYTGVGMSVQGMAAGLSTDGSMTVTFAYGGTAAQISFVPPPLVAGLKTTIAANGLCRVSGGAVYCGAAQSSTNDEVFVPQRADGGELKGAAPRRRSGWRSCPRARRGLRPVACAQLRARPPAAPAPPQAPSPPRTRPSGARPTPRT
jgi:hypothetical protein